MTRPLLALLSSLALAGAAAPERAAMDSGSVTVGVATQAFAAAPALHEFYLLRGTRRGPAALEAHDTRNGRMVRTIRACEMPETLVADPVLERLYVRCTRFVDDDVAAASLVTIDMRTDRVIGVVVLRDEATLHVETLSSPTTVVLSGLHPVLIEPASGKVARTLSNEHGVLTVRGLPGMLLCWDRGERTLRLVDRTGRLRATFDPGVGRAPSAAAYVSATHSLYVAFREAGAIAVFDGASGGFVRTLPVAEAPIELRYDERAQRLHVLCAGSAQAQPSLVTMRGDGSERRAITLSSSSISGHEGGARMELDPGSGRLVIAGDDALDVIDRTSAAPVGTVRARGGRRFAGMTLDTRSGLASIAWSGFTTTVDTIAVRGDVAAPAGDERGDTDGNRTELLAPANDAPWPRDPVVTGVPANPPRGLRSPRWLAFAPDGALVITSVASDMLGRLHEGRYEQRRLRLHGPIVGLAVDAGGTAWLPEAELRDGSAFLARLASDGTVREIPLPRGFGSGGTTPVVDRGGAVWLYAPAGRDHPSRVARIDPDLALHAFAVPPRSTKLWSSPRWIAALPNGVAVMDKRLWSVSPGGETRALIEPIDLAPTTNLAASDEGTLAFASALALVTVERDGSVVGTPLDTLTSRDVRTANSARASILCHPQDVTFGAGRTVWFSCGNAIARVAGDGTIRAFPLPDAQSAPSSLVLGPDGAMWFAEPTHSRIGRLAPDGTLSETTI